MILVSCSNFAFILRILGYLFNLVQWAIPIFLIALITYDLFKAFISGDEKQKQEAMGRIGKRLLYALILFLIPILVKFVFRAVDKASPKGYGTDNSAINWVSCFNQYFK